MAEVESICYYLRIAIIRYVLLVLEIANEILIAHCLSDLRYSYECRLCTSAHEIRDQNHSILMQLHF